MSLISHFIKPLQKLRTKNSLLFGVEKDKYFLKKSFPREALAKGTFLQVQSVYSGKLCSL